MRNGKDIKKTVLLLAGFIIFLTFGLSTKSILAAENEVQIVRVGWFQSDMFQEGMADDQKKSGYCYDYLQKVSNYSGWKYEYVYGDWTELFHMLQSGEIDLLAGVSCTEERMETMLFPEREMGLDQYYLYKHDNDASISAGDLSTLSGKKIGGIVDNRTSVLTLEWMEANQVDAELVYYESFEELSQAFQKGEVDLFAQTIYNVLRSDNISIVAKVGEEPFYLAVSKSRPDFVAELNSAVALMLSMDPFVLQNMQYENYGTTLTSRTLTPEEDEYLAKKGSVTLGYLESYLPYSATDTQGQATGLITDVMQAILSSLEIEDSLFVSYQGFTNYEEMVTALKTGEVDLIFPVCGDLWVLEQDGIDATSAVVSSTETFLYKGSYDKSQIKQIAVNENNKMQILYSQSSFPDAELVCYASIEECLDSVIKGETDGTVLNTMRADLLTGKSKYISLSFLQMNQVESRCIGVREGDTEFLRILNRGLGMIGASYGTDNSYKYMSQLIDYGVVDFINEHRRVVLGVTMAVLAIIISLLLWNLRRQSMLVEQKELHLEEMTAINLELERLKREADEANDAKTSFLFNMSHDIRTPMNAIMGFRDLLEIYQEDPVRRADYLKKIEESSRVLLSIINNVLEMARIEKGTVEIEESAWMVDQCVGDLYSVFREMMEEKEIDFQQEIDVEHHYVFCDQTKMRNVFLNILSNAYKYTEPGGRVQILVKELPYEQEGWTLLRISVVDTGIGMSEEFLPHLFEEFSREKNSSKNTIEGTGLGMPIVKRLVELMNGQISVHSKKGEGTNFIVELPLRIAEKSDLLRFEIVDNKLVVNEDKRILLVEDNDFNAEIAIVILQNAGFLVEHAENGRIACEMMTLSDAGYYDLILMDIQMPEMNGYEATEVIRKMKDEGKAGIPIIAMTANAFEEDKKAAFRAGMNGHLAKPVDIHELMRELGQTIG